MKSYMIKCRASREKFVPTVLDQLSVTADQVNDRAPLAVKPVTGETEIGSTSLHKA